MAIHEIYSKRQMRLRGEFNDVYQYNFIPDKLRIQICKLYNSFFDCNPQEMNQLYNSVYDILTMEYGVDSLNYFSDDIEFRSPKNSNTQILFSFAKRDANTDCFLDVLELVMQHIRNAQNRGRRIIMSVSDATNEINGRFRENAVGYQLDPDSLTIIRVDSQLIHSEVVKPILTLLNADPSYSGTLDEFMLAHEHYRHGNHHDAIVNCGKSFESILKAIHEKRGWSLDKGKNASQLILSCVDKGLFPSYQQEQLIQVNSVLKSGVPTIRNNAGGHGDGVEIITIPEHFVSYMIHLTATNLLFLANAEKALN